MESLLWTQAGSAGAGPCRQEGLASQAGWEKEQAGESLAEPKVGGWKLRETTGRGWGGGQGRGGVLISTSLAQHRRGPRA